MTDKQIADRTAALQRWADSREQAQGSKRVVKAAFTHTFGTGYVCRVPAGAHVTPVADEPGVFWVEPLTFPPGLERHDATYRGIRVPFKNTKEA